MYVISQNKVNLAIKHFVNRELQNNDGVLFKTIQEEQQLFMEQFLNRFYHGFETLFKDKHKACEIFTTRLMKIDGVRFDNKDQDIMPFKIAFEDMSMVCEGRLEGGLFMWSSKNGNVLIDMDFVNISRKEAVHTLIHELIHAMCLTEVEVENKKIQKSGFSGNGKTFNRLNEGITEYIAQLMWSKMYPTKTCPGIGRYATEVKGAKLVMDRFGSVEDFIEDYITNGFELEEEMKEMKNPNGKSLFDYIKSFNSKNIYDVKIQRKVMSEINEFKPSNCELENI